MQIRSFLTLLWIFTSFSGFSQEVIISLKKSEQKNVDGFNLVEFIPRVLYQEIKANKISLYDGPNRIKKISFQTLQVLETQANLHFEEANELAFFEVWESKNKKTEVTLDGISIYGITDKNEIVNFGFVYFNEFKNLFNTRFIDNNANGTYGISVNNYISQRTFEYNITYFNGKFIEKLKPKKREKVSKSIMESYFGKEIKTLKAENKKLVTYQIYPYINDSVALNKKIVKALEWYFNESPEEFFNSVSGTAYPFYQKNKIMIDHLVLTEEWTKTGQNISFNPKFITIYYRNNSSRDTIAFDVIKKWPIVIDDLTILDIIRSKNFEYQVISINNQKMEPEYSKFYMISLLSSSWQKINENVADLIRYNKP